MINLFVSYYPSKNLKRQEEIEKCIRFNIESNWINTVYILLDPGAVNKFYPTSDVNVIPVKLKQRAKYSDFFEAVNKFTTEYDINIIANADIILDETIDLSETMKVSECYALSRWELNPDMTKNTKQVQIYGDSQTVVSEPYLTLSLTELK